MPVTRVTVQVAQMGRHMNLLEFPSATKLDKGLERLAMF
jgi:hypothetical protein